MMGRLPECDLNVVEKLPECDGKVFLRLQKRSWNVARTLPERCEKGYFYVNGSFRYNVVTTLRKNVIDTKM